MESSQYVNIFATKGIEYLLVIGFLFVLIFFWRFLNKSTPHPESVVEKLFNTLNSWFQMNPEYFYHQGHSWAAPESEGVVKVGIDDFAQKFFGKLDSINLPKVGSHIQQGDIGWQVIIGSKPINILSPVSGKIIAINENVIRSPEIVCKTPYEDGWLLKVKNPKANIDFKNLLSGKLALNWMEETVKNLQKKISSNYEVGIVMQDGGIPISGFGKNISPENWNKVVNEFFMTD